VIIAIEVVNKTRVSGKVYVTGQVRNRGGFEIPGGETLTVSKAILNAGGFSDFSDKKNVRLIRKTANGSRLLSSTSLIFGRRGIWIRPGGSAGRFDRCTRPVGELLMGAIETHTTIITNRAGTTIKSSG